jgi:hypothetical protein
MNNISHFSPDIRPNAGMNIALNRSHFSPGFARMYSMNLDHLRPVDLAFAAAKKRQSPRTGFVHFFYGNETALDTIPFYENMCFAIALLYQKKAEAALEAKDLILRLLSFQTAEGNFPVYLHDYPRCFGFLLGLKIAPLLLRLTRDLPYKSSINLVGVECRTKIEESLGSIFSFYEVQRNLRPLPPLWEYRYQMCKAIWTGGALPLDALDSSKFSASDWWEYWVTQQLQERPKCCFYHPGLAMCVGSFLFDRSQDGPEPSLALIDWACTEHLEEARFSQDNPMQMGLAALDSVQVEQLQLPLVGCNAKLGASFAMLSAQETEGWNLFWKKERVHRLSLEVLDAKVISTVKGNPHLTIELPSLFEINRDDLFEIAFYVDAAPNIDLSINGVKGTSFHLGDWIKIQSSGDHCTSLRFDLLEGEGDFCGHIYRSNRSNQRSLTQCESFDWKIGLRTLRRSEKCVLSVQLTAYLFS